MLYWNVAPEALTRFFVLGLAGHAHHPRLQLLNNLMILFGNTRAVSPIMGDFKDTE